MHTLARLFLALSFFFFLATGFSQSASYQLLGQVSGAEKEALTGATVVALDPQDSTLIAFAISDGAGQFELRKITQEAVVLQITYIGYGTFQQGLSFTPGQVVLDLGEIWLSPENLTLEEVVVKSEHIPVLIKGDTIQYQADAFLTRPDDNVENLLKKLPGVEVDRDGSIKAQGEEVQKVLVDGKPFFGNNAQVATRNLPADAVDAVQVFDKESDLAEFSGIDDGNEEKTINLVLKEDKKAGQFGQISGGYGSDGRFEGKVNVNRFSGATQLSLLGSANNINEPGFSIMDYIDFMGGFDRMMSEGGGMIQMSGDQMGMPLNLDNSNGINSSQALGLNLNHDFNGNTQFSSNYFGSRLERVLDQQYTRTNFLADDAFETLGQTSENARTDGHRLNLELKNQLSDRQRLQIRSSLGYTSGRTARTQQLMNSGSRGVFENESDQQYRMVPNRWLVNSSLQYFLKFKEPGRLLTASVQYETQMDDSEQSIFSRNLFAFDFSTPSFTDSLDQRQLTDDQQSYWRAGLSYTEPISERWYWQNRFSIDQDDDRRDKQFLDRSESQEYQLNTTLSDGFTRAYNNQRLGTGLLFTGQKSRFDIFVEAQRAGLSSTTKSTANVAQNDFWRLLPRVSWKYEFTDSRNLNLRYSTNVRAPALEQLQTLVDNSNTLSIYQGNPGLKPEYRHDFSASLTLIDAFSFTNFFANFRSSFIQDRVVNALSIDSLLQQVRQPVNTDYEWSNQLYASFSTPIRPIGMTIRLHGRGNYSKGFVLVNGQSDQVDRWNQEWSLGFSNRKKEKVDWEVGSTWNFSQAAYELQADFNQNYARQDWFATADWFLPGDWVLSSEIEYQRFSNEAFGASNGFTLWQASVRKSFLQNNRLILQLSVFDLLNQNTGIQRQNAFNYFEESRSNALGRFAMLSATYKIGRVGGEQ